MTEMLTVISERVDDIPLLLAHQERMGVQPLLDEHFMTHGNWQGLSLGWVATTWLTHILSQANHRLEPCSILGGEAAGDAEPVHRSGGKGPGLQR